MVEGRQSVPANMRALPSRWNILSVLGISFEVFLDLFGLDTPSVKGTTVHTVHSVYVSILE